MTHLSQKNKRFQALKFFLLIPTTIDKKIGFVDQFEEKQSDNLMCMIDDITYIDDLPNFDQYDDDYVLQTEANIVEQSKFGLWEEVHFQQLENND